MNTEDLKLKNRIIIIYQNVSVDEIGRAQMSRIYSDFGNKRDRRLQMDSAYFLDAKAKSLSQRGRLFALYDSLFSLKSCNCIYHLSFRKSISQTLPYYI